MIAPRPDLTRPSTPLYSRACHAKTQQLFARLFLPSIMSALGLLATAVHAEQKCNGPTWTPDSRFELKGGEAYDKQTKLTWKRCPEGMRWNGSGCSGTAEEYSWHDAVKRFPVGGNEWRLPNADELASIRAGNNDNSDHSKMAGPVNSGCFWPAINRNVFVDATSAGFLSSSIYVPNSAGAWFVNFGLGNTHWVDKVDTFHVRLVRGGRHLGPLAKAGQARVISNPAELATLEKKRVEEKQRQEAAEARRREANHPKTGSCVQITFTGGGLLNSGRQVTMRGRVTSEGGSYTFLKIVSIRGNDSIFWDGKTYYQGDEIEFATESLQRCD